MSFILDALKKSEHKRRAQAGQEPYVIFEAPAPTYVSRRWILILVAFLLLCILLLLGVLVFQRTGDSPTTFEGALGAVEEPARTLVPVSREMLPAVSVPASQEQPEATGSQQSVAEQRREVVVDASLPSENVPLVVTPEASTPSDGQVYSISDLPAEVRSRLPALQMALHAYNAADADASLVQINGRLVREGAQITENISVDEITSDGAVLRSGNYRFLLPRRGQ